MLPSKSPLNQNLPDFRMNLFCFNAHSRTVSKSQTISRNVDMLHPVDGDLVTSERAALGRSQSAEGKTKTTEYRRKQTPILKDTDQPDDVRTEKCVENT